MDSKSFINRRDIIIIIILLTISIAMTTIFYLKNNIETPAQAEIIFQGESTKIIDLNKESMTFSIDPLPQVEFTLKDGEIAFTKSNCPDQICVQTGWLNRPGQFAACMPNEVLLLIQPAQ